MVSGGTRCQDLKEFPSALSVAERSLSEQERQLISKWIERLTSCKESESPLLKGTGLSQPKGKETDLANWGGILFSGQELNVDTQQVALSDWNNQWELMNASRNLFISRNPYDKAKTKALKPIPQVDTGSSETFQSDSENPEKVRRWSGKCHIRVMTDLSESRVIPPTSGNGKYQLKEKADIHPIERMIKKALIAKLVKIWRSKIQVIEPAQQIVPNVYLGMALGQIEQTQRNGLSLDSDSSDSSDDSSSSVSTQDDQELSTSDEESLSSRDHHLPGRGKKFWHRSRKQ